MNNRIQARQEEKSRFTDLEDCSKSEIMGYSTARSGRGRGRGSSGNYTKSGRGYNNVSRSTNKNSNSTRKDQTTAIKFQLHGKKVCQTATYTQVLDHIIV